jgi:hypothetical protein
MMTTEFPASGRNERRGGNKPPRHLFVNGVHRSGTTLLAKILSSQPSFSGFERTGVPMDEGQHLTRVFPVRDKLARYSFMPRAHQTEASRLNTPEHAEQIHRDWGPYWDQDKEVLVEKSPGNILRTRLLQAYFPDSAFILIHRHPVAHAMAVNKWMNRRVHTPALWNWVRCHETFEKDAAHLERTHVIAYENFVANPGPELDRLSEFLGLEIPVPDLEFRQGLNDGYFARWREYRASPRGRADAGLARALLDKRVRRWGYSFDEAEAG